MKQPHDTRIGRQVLTRNLNRLQTVTADKGYDWDNLREELREDDIRPAVPAYVQSVSKKSVTL